MTMGPRGRAGIDVKAKGLILKASCAQGNLLLLQYNPAFLILGILIATEMAFT